MEKFGFIGLGLLLLNTQLLGSKKNAFGIIACDNWHFIYFVYSF